MTDEMVDAMTIIGNPEECRDQMQEFFDAGVAEIRLVLNEPDMGEYTRVVEALAPGG